LLRDDLKLAVKRCHLLLSALVGQASQVTGKTMLAEQLAESHGRQAHHLAHQSTTRRIRVFMNMIGV